MNLLTENDQSWFTKMTVKISDSTLKYKTNVMVLMKTGSLPTEHLN